MTTSLFSVLLTTLSVLSMATAVPQTTAAPPTGTESQAKVQSLIADKTPISYAVLAPLWSQLPAITVEKALGTYRGGLFPQPGATPKSDPINWWGKQIISATSVNPLLVNPPSNTTASKKDESIVFPYPRADIAQARNVEHEGVVSATIIYSKLPLLDYFRVIKDDGKDLWLLGKSDMRGKPSEPAYFYLKRVEGQKIDFTFKNPYPNSAGF